MERINQYASKFISYVSVFPDRKETSRFKGSAEHLPCVDLSDKVMSKPTVSRELNHDDSIAKLYITIDENRFGFDDKIYPYFFRFATYISRLPIFTHQASEEFIMEETFNWIVDSYRFKKIQKELITYLENRVDEETEVRTYHFPVLNLHIQEPFKIGDVTFQFFTKEYFDQYWDPLINRKDTKEDFDKAISRYCGKVFISSSVKAESKKSEEIAFSIASLAMDVLRLFSPAVYVPSKIFKIDLEKRININYSSDFLVETHQREKVISVNMCANNEPYYFDKKLEKLVFTTGLSIFSDFIKSPQNNDLSRLIIHSISFYSFILSISDYHLRISQIIMVIEGLLLEEGWVKSMEKKTTNRICKLIFSNDLSKFSKLNSVMNSMYRIRHEITHKGNRLKIDMGKFRDLQVTVVNLLQKIIVLNKKFEIKMN